jgi:hypothetical protein
MALNEAARMVGETAGVKDVLLAEKSVAAWA